MPQRLADLVGRAMIDQEFLVDLQRAPDAILAEYDLNEDESRAIREALVKLSDTPSAEKVVALRTALLRRVAT
jgi:hypothetical protein